MTASRLLCVLLCLVLAAPAGALAQQTPFAPIPQAPPESPQPAPAPTSSTPDSDDGLNSTQLLLLSIAGLVLIVGIGWAIVRDARAAAPVEKGHAHGDAEDRPRATKPPPAQRVKSGRAKAKAARRSRKRNR